MNKKKIQFVGIDVSHKTFNAHWKDSDKAYFNNGKGWRELLKEAPDGSAFAMEATGNYHYRLAAFLHSKGFPVFVFNPYKVLSYVRSLSGGKSKTDKIDARRVHDFAVKYRLQNIPWKPMSPKHARARVIVSLLKGLSKINTAASNMNHAASLTMNESDELSDVMSNISGLCLEQQDALERELYKLAKEIWPQRFRLLQTIPGIGAKTAAVLLVCAKGMEFESSGRLSSFCGLVSKNSQSGTTVNSKGKIVKVGNAYLRGLLYMCAESAICWNPACSDLYNRLRAKGKKGNIPMVAVMHRLLKIAFGVVQSGEPYRGGKVSRSLRASEVVH